eukprot:gene7409-5218_t
MVLAELGQKIGQAISKISSKSILEERDVQELLNEIARALLQADVNINIVKKLQISVKTEFAMAEEGAGLNKRKILQNAIFNAIKKILDPGVAPFYPAQGKCSVVMFVGLQGSGKTTSCTKYAAYWQRKGLKTALVCADTFRAGAYDQLRQNATKAKVRFYGSLTEADPVVIAAEGVAELKKEKYDLIVVDTSGRHKQEAALFEEMKQVEVAVQPNDIVFVMSATDGQAVEEQARNFRQKVKVGSVIVTKLDCEAKGGGALSAVAATGSPIVFIGTGEHFDDFELFKPNSFVQKMLGMGDISGLMDTLKDANIDKNDKLMKRFQEGQFTMRDMYEHLQNIHKMGSVGKLMEMIPGMSGLAGMAGEQGDAALHGFIHMLDSMTPAELDDGKVKKMMTPSRMFRIARGSGHSLLDVQSLVLTYNKFEEMVKKMGKVNFKAMTQDPGSALSGRMGQQQMGQIAKMINPNVLRQMGGMGGLQNMVQQVQNMAGGGAGGMPDMSQMANMMKMMRGKRATTMVCLTIPHSPNSVVVQLLQEIPYRTHFCIRPYSYELAIVSKSNLIQMRYALCEKYNRLVIFLVYIQLLIILVPPFCVSRSVLILSLFRIFFFFYQKVQKSTAAYTDNFIKACITILFFIYFFHIIIFIYPFLVCLFVEPLFVRLLRIQSRTNRKEKERKERLWSSRQESGRDSAVLRVSSHPFCRSPFTTEAIQCSWDLVRAVKIRERERKKKKKKQTKSIASSGGICLFSAFSFYGSREAVLRCCLVTLEEHTVASHLGANRKKNILIYEVKIKRTNQQQQTFQMASSPATAAPFQRSRIVLQDRFTVVTTAPSQAPASPYGRPKSSNGGGGAAANFPSAVAVSRTDGGIEVHVRAAAAATRHRSATPRQGSAPQHTTRVQQDEAAEQAEVILASGSARSTLQSSSLIVSAVETTSPAAPPLTRPPYNGLPAAPIVPATPAALAKAKTKARVASAAVSAVEMSSSRPAHRLSTAAHRERAAVLSSRECCTPGGGECARRPRAGHGEEHNSRSAEDAKEGHSRGNTSHRRGQSFSDSHRQRAAAAASPPSNAGSPRCYSAARENLPFYEPKSVVVVEEASERRRHEGEQEAALAQMVPAHGAPVTIVHRREALLRSEMVDEDSQVGDEDAPPAIETNAGEQQHGAAALPLQRTIPPPPPVGGAGPSANTPPTTAHCSSFPPPPLPPTVSVTILPNASQDYGRSEAGLPPPPPPPPGPEGGEPGRAYSRLNVLFGYESSPWSGSDLSGEGEEEDETLDVRVETRSSSSSLPCSSPFPSFCSSSPVSSATAGSGTAASESLHAVPQRCRPTLTSGCEEEDEVVGRTTSHSPEGPGEEEPCCPVPVSVTVSPRIWMAATVYDSGLLPRGYTPSPQPPPSAEGDRERPPGPRHNSFLASGPFTSDESLAAAAVIQEERARRDSRTHPTAMVGDDDGQQDQEEEAPALCEAAVYRAPSPAPLDPLAAPQPESMLHQLLRGGSADSSSRGPGGSLGSTAPFSPSRSGVQRDHGTASRSPAGSPSLSFMTVSASLNLPSRGYSEEPDPDAPVVDGKLIQLQMDPRLTASSSSCSTTAGTTPERAADGAKTPHPESTTTQMQTPSNNTSRDSGASGCGRLEEAPSSSTPHFLAFQNSIPLTTSSFIPSSGNVLLNAHRTIHLQMMQEHRQAIVRVAAELYEEWWEKRYRPSGENGHRRLVELLPESIMSSCILLLPQRGAAGASKLGSSPDCASSRLGLSSPVALPPSSPDPSPSADWQRNRNGGLVTTAGRRDTDVSTLPQPPPPSRMMNPCASPSSPLVLLANAHLSRRCINLLDPMAVQMQSGPCSGLEAICRMSFHITVKEHLQLMDTYVAFQLQQHQKKILGLMFDCLYKKMVAIPAIQMIERQARRIICMKRDLYLRDMIEYFMLSSPQRIYLPQHEVEMNQIKERLGQLFTKENLLGTAYGRKNAPRGLPQTYKKEKAKRRYLADETEDSAQRAPGGPRSLVASASQPTGKPRSSRVQTPECRIRTRPHSAVPMSDKADTTAAEACGANAEESVAGERRPRRCATLRCFESESRVPEHYPKKVQLPGIQRKKQRSQIRATERIFPGPRARTPPPLGDATMDDEDFARIDSCSQSKKEEEDHYMFARLTPLRFVNIVHQCLLIIPTLFGQGWIDPVAAAYKYTHIFFVCFFWLVGWLVLSIECGRYAQDTREKGKKNRTKKIRASVFNYIIFFSLLCFFICDAFESSFEMNLSPPRCCDLQLVCPSHISQLIHHHERIRAREESQSK